MPPPDPLSSVVDVPELLEPDDDPLEELCGTVVIGGVVVNPDESEPGAWQAPRTKSAKYRDLTPRTVPLRNRAGQGLRAAPAAAQLSGGPRLGFTPGNRLGLSASDRS
jgi:hypothetical protein